MSLSAKILPFPSRRETPCLSPRDAATAARGYLEIPRDARSDNHRDQFLGSPDVLLAICSILSRQRDLAPLMVLEQATDIYRWISQSQLELGLFDERDYFLGETGLLAGVASRHLGRREEALLWLDRAEAGFRHTMNPAPGLANVAYARLALRFEMGRYQDVLELAPSLVASFEKLRMGLERSKCRLLLAMTLKQTGQHQVAIEILNQLREEKETRADSQLAARVLAELGDLQQLEGQLAPAMSAFQEALSLLGRDEVSLAKADLKLYVGGIQKALGSLPEAAEAFRDAQRDYEALGMQALVAYTHLVIGETLLEMNREREAQWEILAALPAIEEMRLVPEGFAAFALLRESLSRRKPDVDALQRLRAHLQAKG